MCKNNSGFVYVTWFLCFVMVASFQVCTDHMTLNEGVFRCKIYKKG